MCISLAVTKVFIRWYEFLMINDGRETGPSLLGYIRNCFINASRNAPSAWLLHCAQFITYNNRDILT